MLNYKLMLMMAFITKSLGHIPLCYMSKNQLELIVGEFLNKNFGTSPQDDYVKRLEGWPVDYFGFILNDSDSVFGNHDTFGSLESELKSSEKNEKLVIIAFNAIQESNELWIQAIVTNESIESKAHMELATMITFVATVAAEKIFERKYHAEISKQKPEVLQHWRIIFSLHREDIDPQELLPFIHKQEELQKPVDDGVRDFSYDTYLYVDNSVTINF